MSNKNIANLHSFQKEKQIPRRLHCHFFQKLVVKNRSSTLLARRSLCSQTFSMVLHNKLNRSMKKLSYKVLRSVKLNCPTSQLHFRYGFNSEDEISFVADILKYLKQLDSLQLRILNESIKIEQFNCLVRSFKSLSSLKALSLSVIYAHGNTNTNRQLSLTQILKSMRNLETLSFNFSWCRTIKIEQLCKAFKTLKKLTSLTIVMPTSGIEDGDMKFLESCLPELKSLKCLRFHTENNQISIIGLDNIMKGIKQLPSLKELSLNFNKCQVIALDFSTFKDSMQALDKLESLSLALDKIKIFKDSIIDLGEALSYLKNLKRLKINLFECHLNEKEIVNLGEGISKLNHLTELGLDLTLNQLHDEELARLLESLRGLKQIKNFSLSFSRNLVGDKVLDSLSKTLSCYSELEKIDINGFSCKFSDKGIAKLAQCIQRTAKLREITLIFNRNDKIGEEGVKVLMDNLLQVKGMNEIRIDFGQCGLSQELEEAYIEKYRTELSLCNIVIFFGY